MNEDKYRISNEIDLDDFDFGDLDDDGGDYDRGMDPAIEGLLGTIDELRAANRLLRWSVVSLLVGNLALVARLLIG